MTRNDFLIKWGVYALAILPVWWCELFLLNRFPLAAPAEASSELLSRFA